MNLLHTITHLHLEELQEIRDIGPIAAGSIVYYFEENEDLIERLLQEISPILPVITSHTEADSSSLIAGKSFCVTGSFADISRDEIHEKIETAGGEVRTSVSKNLDYLIAGEAAGSKLEKARSLGVNVIELEEFLQMI